MEFEPMGILLLHEAFFEITVLEEKVRKMRAALEAVACDGRRGPNQCSYCNHLSPGHGNVCPVGLALELP